MNELTAYVLLFFFFFKLAESIFKDLTDFYQIQTSTVTWQIG